MRSLLLSLLLVTSCTSPAHAQYGQPIGSDDESIRMMRELEQQEQMARIYQLQRMTQQMRRDEEQYERDRRAQQIRPLVDGLTGLLERRSAPQPVPMYIPYSYPQQYQQPYSDNPPLYPVPQQDNDDEPYPRPQTWQPTYSTRPSYWNQPTYLQPRPQYQEPDIFRGVRNQRWNIQSPPAGFRSSAGSASGFGDGSNSDDHYSRGYVDRNGTPHSGSWRTNPNDTKLDNYSTRGNYNPHTGKFGTRSPW